MADEKVDVHVDAKISAAGVTSVKLKVPEFSTSGMDVATFKELCAKAYQDLEDKPEDAPEIKKEQVRVLAKGGDQQILKNEELVMDKISAEKKNKPKERVPDAEREHIIAEKEMDLEQYYDLVVRVDSFISLFEGEGRKGWEITTPLNAVEEENYFDRAIRFSILGDFKKGKTWLLSKLCEGQSQREDDVVLQADQVVHTPGLCWKRLEILGDKMVLLDSKGENSPVENISPNSLNDRRAEEYLLRDLLCRMSDAFIFLVNSLGMNEQRTLQLLCRQLAVIRQFSNVSVVHNLKHIKTKEELDIAVDEITDVNEGEGFQEQEQEVKLAQGSRTVRYFTKSVARGYRTSVPQTHYVLGCEGEPSGENNPYVFQLIRNNFRFMVPEDRTSPLLEELADAVKKHVAAYLSSTEIVNPEQIVVNVVDEQGEIVPPNSSPTHFGQKRFLRCTMPNKDVRVRPFPGMEYVPAPGGGTGTAAAGAPWRISEYFDETEQIERVRCEIKLPGYSEEQLEEDLNPSSPELLHERVLTIEDNTNDTQGYKITVWPAKLNHEKSLDETPEFETYYLPNPLLKVPIEVRKRVTMEGMFAFYHEGIIVLSFAKEKGSSEFANVSDNSATVAVDCMSDNIKGKLGTSENYGFPKGVQKYWELQFIIWADGQGAAAGDLKDMSTLAWPKLYHQYLSVAKTQYDEIKSTVIKESGSNGSKQDQVNPGEIPEKASETLKNKFEIYKKAGGKKELSEWVLQGYNAGDLQAKFRQATYTFKPSSDFGIKYNEGTGQVESVDNVGQGQVLNARNATQIKEGSWIRKVNDKDWGTDTNADPKKLLTQKDPFTLTIEVPSK